MGTAFAVAILAGGASRRMGRDKALLPVAGGGTLLERLGYVAAGITPAAIFIVGRERPKEWGGPEAIFLPDPVERQGEGPLGGIATALEAAEARGIPGILAIACDMPRVTTETLDWLATEAEGSREEHGASTVGEDGGPEPLFTVYRIAALPHLRACLAEGERSPRRAIKRGQFALLVPPPEVAASLANVNTPEDWAAVQEAKRD
jgi:molybdopterin-guanine dinucleotide biosynthesis protein A